MISPTRRSEREAAEDEFRQHFAPVARPIAGNQGWLRLLRQISLQDKWICLDG